MRNGSPLLRAPAVRGGRPEPGISLVLSAGIRRPCPRPFDLLQDPSDPAAQWTGAHQRHAFVAYADNYLIDLNTAIDVEATRAVRRAEVGAATTMRYPMEACFGLKPQRLSGDSAYGSAEILAWMVEEKNIAPHVPVWDKSERSGRTFSHSDFELTSARPNPRRGAACAVHHSSVEGWPSG
jgi:hypothetical protein